MEFAFELDACVCAYEDAAGVKVSKISLRSICGLFIMIIIMMMILMMMIVMLILMMMMMIIIANCEVVLERK